VEVLFKLSFLFTFVYCKDVALTVSLIKMARQLGIV
jgi:hypothetical protein